MQQDKFQYDHILVRFGELTTKGKNRKDFIKRLLTNVRNALREHPTLTYERTHDRMYIMLHEEDHQAVCDKLKEVLNQYNSTDLEDVFFEMYSKEVC